MNILFIENGGKGTVVAYNDLFKMACYTDMELMSWTIVFLVIFR